MKNKENKSRKCIICKLYDCNCLNNFYKEQDKLINTSNIDNPDHYGGKFNRYETIKVIEAWKLNFNLGNTVKYISRAGKKDIGKLLEDLEKAKWYLEREINNLKNK